MKVTSSKTIRFPKFNWGMERGAVRELPKDKEAAEAILNHPAITEVAGNKEKEKSEPKASKDKAEGEKKETETKDNN